MTGLYINPEAGAFFSLKGRAKRSSFILTTAVWYVAFFACTLAWDAQRTPVFLWIILLILPLKFIFTAKRLHDINLSALLASPLIALSAVDLLGQTLNTLHLSLPSGWIGLSFNTGMFLLASLCGLIVLTDIGLIFMPGTKGPNRFGPDPRGHVLPLNEVY